MYFKRLIVLLMILILGIATGMVLAQEETTNPEIDIVQNYLENDFDPQYLADDVVFYDGVYDTNYEGTEAVQDYFRPFYEDRTISDVSLDPQNYYLSGNSVVADFTYNNTPITGIFNVEDGQITRANFFYNDEVALFDYNLTPSENYALGMNREMAEFIEESPQNYYNTTVTIRGHVESILTPYSFILQDTEPFDLTPANFIIFDDSNEGFRVDVNEGARLEVTGTLRPYNLDTLQEDLPYDLSDAPLIGNTVNDNFALIASYTRLIDRVLNPPGEDAPADVESDLGGLDNEMAELIEDNPQEFYNTVVTVEGVIEEVITENGFILQDMEPFDLTPAEFIVADAQGNAFMEMGAANGIAEGMRVRVTGTLYPFEFDDLQQEIGWDLDDTAWAGRGSDDFAMVADQIVILND